MVNQPLKNTEIQQSSFPNYNKEKLSNLSIIDKLRYLDNLRINYPKMNEALRKIEECQKSTLSFKKPKCISIIGPSGSGKTTLIEVYRKKYPDISKDEYTKKTIFYSRIPCPARIGSLPVKMLHDLGDPFYDKRSKIVIQTQRLYDLIKRCEVELIVLDEVQHLVDRNSEKLIRDSSDWFKELIDATNIPIVFLGMPDSRKIFIENEQLANRAQLYEELSPFEYDDVFLKVLYLFDSNLPLKEMSQLAQSDMSRRIFLATRGLMKNIRDLIVEATILAINTNHDRITMPILAESFNKMLYFNYDKNPFLPGFELK